MKYRIHGELAQVAQLQLEAGETCWSSRGALMTLTPAIEWRLRVPGGLGGAAKRIASGEGIALTYIEAKADGAQVVLASNQPGKVINWDLADGPVLTTRGSFMAAFGQNVDISVAVTRRLGAAFFGGAGLFLQKISGQGMVLIHGAGDFLDRRLAQGETILVSTGNLAAFGESIDYDIQSVAGCRRMFFGGEGIFMTKLTGPGRVLLQTLKRGAGQAKANAATAG